MTKRTKIALIAGTTVLALAGIGGGMAFAAGSATPSPTAVLTASTTGGASTAPGTPTAKAPAHHRRSLLNRAEHGQVTVHTKTGDETVDIQRGQVIAVTGTTVTVRSQDGFTATYTLGSASKVRAKGTPSTMANVHDGDHVNVLATQNGTTLTIRRLGDPGPARK